jgi:hypothetical protein
VKAGGGDKTADPQLYERRMLGVDAEVTVFYVRDTSGNMICLINGEAVETRRDGGAQDAETDKNVPNFM